MPLVQDGACLVQSAIHVVERGILGAERGQVGPQEQWRRLLSLGGPVLPHAQPQLGQLGLQLVDTTCRVIGDLLGDTPFPFGTNQLLPQFCLLPLRPGQKLHHPLAARELDRHRLQRVDSACQLGDFRLGLTEHDEQQRGDRQSLLSPLLAGLVGLPGALHLLEDLDGSVLGRQQLPGGHQLLRVPDRRGARSRPVPQRPRLPEASLGKVGLFVGKTHVGHGLDQIPLQRLAGQLLT